MVADAGETIEPSDESGGRASAGRVSVMRRALFARDLSVWGYELMCTGDARRAGLGAEVSLLNAIAELGVKQLVAEKTALISIAADTLVGRLPLPASDGTVLVLRVEASQVTPDLVEAAEDRIDDGFGLALSGELWAPEVAPLLQRASIIRVPFPQLALGVMARIGARPKGQQLWIDGVDEPHDFPNTRQYVPNYVSGDFLLKPSPVEGRRAPRNLTVLMELMTKLRDPDVSLSAIESILRRDAGLSVTLLRFLNSAGFGLRVQVNNIRQAVALLGLAEFQKWVTLVGLGEASYKPNEVLLTALVRAKTCELLANRGHEAATGTGTAFMVGLFSLLDAMLDQPLEVVLNDLPVSDVMKNALLEQSGFEGEILAAVLEYERGLYPESLPEHTGEIFECWQKAVKWADSLRGALPEAPVSRATRARR